MLRETCVAAAIAIAAGGAYAQSRPKPDDPHTAAPPPPPRASAFEGYRPYRDEPMRSWREVNDEVGRVGGHTGVVRADRETAPPPQAPAPAPKGRP